MTQALEMINICIYIVWEKEQWKTGHFKMFHVRKKTLYSLGNGTFYPLGTIFSSGNRLYSGIRDNPGKRDMINGRGSDHFSSGKHPLGIGNLGDEVQTKKHVFAPGYQDR